MIKELQVTAISYKTRGIKAGGEWLEVKKGIELDQFVKGNVYKLEIAENFQDKLELIRVINE